MVTNSVSARFSLPPLAKSLSAKLLVLTVAFVMLAEVLIYCPSIGRFRLVYLQERLAAAHLAILALEATPDQMVSEEMERELMAQVGAYAVSLRKPDSVVASVSISIPSFAATCRTSIRPRQRRVPFGPSTMSTGRFPGVSFR